MILAHSLPVRLESSGGRVCGEQETARTPGRKAVAKGTTLSSYEQDPYIYSVAIYCVISSDSTKSSHPNRGCYSRQKWGNAMAHG